MVGRLKWIEMVDSAEAEVTDRLNVAREIQSSSEQLSQQISTFRVI